MPAWPPAASRAYAALCARLYALVSEDKGGRGVAHLAPGGLGVAGLAAAGLAFLAATAAGAGAGARPGAGALLVLTGFPCRVREAPPTETDGPPGAVALAAGFLRLGGARASIATDDSSARVVAAAAGASADLAAAAAAGRFAALSFPPAAAWARAADTARLAAAIRAHAHVVAVERAGAGADGGFRTMRGARMDALVAPLDVALTAGTAAGRGPPLEPLLDEPLGEVLDEPLDEAPSGGGGARTSMGEGEGGAARRARRGVFASAHAQAAALVPGFDALEEEAGGRGAGGGAGGGWPARTSTGIGDGGNECGMGGAAAGVRRHIPLGVRIAAAAPADALVAAGVSNWGAWGVVAAAEGAARAHAAGAPPRAAAAAAARAPGFALPTAAEADAAVDAAVAAGARDGITGAGGGSVDGLPSGVHRAKLAALRGALEEAFCRGGGGGGGGDAMR